MSGLGALLEPDGRCRFRVWAPFAERVILHLVDPKDRLVPMERSARGYHEALVPDARAGTLYRYVIDDAEYADPASRSQPQGVHGPSEVIDVDALRPAIPFADHALADYVIYEAHIGTFSSKGTFDAAIEHLDELRALGVTALEIMPVAQFPGERNWGYDGVFPFAAQDSYGGPTGLARLIEACHARNLAVILDVVYNHLGPEGNVLRAFGPYFTDRYPGPWGDAINFDGAGSDEVRTYFIENALWWTRDLGIDALRLDAVHAIVDTSPVPFLAELAERVRASAAQHDRHVILIAESESNDARVTTPVERGGLGMDAQWSDDTHHALHTLVTGEQDGYYADYGSLGQLARALAEGFAYQGDYSAYRDRRHGSDARSVRAEAHVVCAQNHDQVGNRMQGERLSALVDEATLRLVAGVILLSPHVPMLFMGEEYAETAPFQYFVSHSEPALIEAVRTGRAREFEAFDWAGEPPDPQDEKTFLRSKLDRSLRENGMHASMLTLVTDLLRARRVLPSLSTLDATRVAVTTDDTREVLTMRRWSDEDETVTVFCFAREEREVSLPEGSWRVVLASAGHDMRSDTVRLVERSFVLLQRRT